MPIQDYSKNPTLTKAVLVDLALIQGAPYPDPLVTFVDGGDPHVEIVNISTLLPFRGDIGSMLVQHPSGLFEFMSVADFNAQYTLAP